MDNETFEIVITPYTGNHNRYRMKVEITYRSEQVIRFRISGGYKFMLMEKLILKNKGQWKIKETNFDLAGDPPKIARTMKQIQDEIDFYLAGRPAPVNKYKDKP